MHRRLVGALVEAGLRIVDPVAGQHDLALRTSTGVPPRSVNRSVPNGTCPASASFERARIVVDHADLERRRAAEDVLRPRRVLHARKLHDDPVGALLLDDRLGDAELVDAVAQDRDVLLDRAVLDALLRFGLERRDQPELAARASCVRTTRSGNAVSISTRAFVRSASSRKRSTTFWPSRETPPYWMRFSRISERMSVV